MSKAIFITGGTGYLGSYVVDYLLRHSDAPLKLMVRAKSRSEAVDKAWKAMQLHRSAAEFEAALPRLHFVSGDLTAPGLGIDAAERSALCKGSDSILHIAASLNRRSEKACLNQNLRGGLAMLQLAREIADAGGLRRFSFVSTVAVAGKRSHELVHEDASIDWERSDYDPYGRTKKFCEHMLRQLAGPIPFTIFRPSIVLGDSRMAETSQFDMARAFCWLVDLPVLPLDPATRLDIVNADYVGSAIAAIHIKDKPRYDTYHLSSGKASCTAAEIAEVVRRELGQSPPRFAPALGTPFQRFVHSLTGRSAPKTLRRLGTLLDVFLPYIYYDTVFDNERVCSEMGKSPTPFRAYAPALYRYAKDVGFEYPAQSWPASSKSNKEKAA